MTRRIAWIVAALCFASSTSTGAAFAATVEVKAAKGVEKHEPVGEATEFKHVWKLDGKEEWSTELPVRAKIWVTNSRRVVKAGSYTVEILGGDGGTLGEVSFTVK
ncbi:MAG TPA: DUF2914 domain-containing protein [Haliangiales bacterium]|nr:DUF2914 domain-containing protein [Haliangiales bacterium]